MGGAKTKMLLYRVGTYTHPGVLSGTSQRVGAPGRERSEGHALYIEQMKQIG